MISMIRYTVLLLLFVSSIQAQQVFHKKIKLMGSRFDLYVVSEDSVDAEKYFDIAVSEISRIEKKISSWDKDSETSKINKYAGIKPVKVSKELFDLIKRSLVISELTEGAFDITYASTDRIWKFDGTMKAMPSKEDIKKSVSKVGYKKIILNEEKQTVFLPEEGMKIGFGAIGKGYAADKTKELLISKGVKAGIINASGDMNTWGRQPDGKEWTVAVTNPFNKNKAFALLPITNGAVVTSGNYEKYVIFDGKRYTHIIDPRTGYPATGVISVTVFAPKAELADALATSVFVTGTEVGINLVNQLPNTECIIIDDKGEIFTSDNIKINNDEKTK